MYIILKLNEICNYFLFLFSYVSYIFLLVIVKEKLAQPFLKGSL